jgi:hypothetical protein
MSQRLRAYRTVVGEMSFPSCAIFAHSDRGLSEFPDGSELRKTGILACSALQRLRAPQASGCLPRRLAVAGTMKSWRELTERAHFATALFKRRGTGARAPDVLDHYVTKYPGPQNAVDAVPGWNHAFPPETGVSAGPAHFYQDSRIAWCLNEVGPLDNRVVLELGPLEGMHSYMLAKAGAHHVDAIEANALAYVRCLITKEILQIENVAFHLGDFNLWLENPPRRYDLIIASGVLYHSADPIKLLERIARNADTFYIWTHYFDSEAMKEDDLRRVPFSGKIEQRSFQDLSIQLFERSYFQAWRDPRFCGGFQDRHYWMTKQDILAILATLGFTSVTAHDEPAHPNGPSLSIFARRSR